MLPHLLMCESTNERDKKWCLNCTKCAEHVLFNLSVNKVPEIDADLFFENGPWFVNKIKPKLQDRRKKTPGNWFSGLTFYGHIDSFQHVISKINPDCFKSDIAKENFIQFQDILAWENKVEEDFTPPLANKIESANAKLVFDRMKEILHTNESVQGKHWGISPVSFDLEFDVFDKEEFESFNLQLNEKKIGLKMTEEALPTEQSNLSAQGLSQINHFTMEGYSCLSGTMNRDEQTEVKFSKTFNSLIVGKKINKLSLSIFTDKTAEIVDIRSPGASSASKFIEAGWNNIEVNLVEDKDTQRIEIAISIPPQDGELSILVGNFSVFHSE